MILWIEWEMLKIVLGVIYCQGFIMSPLFHSQLPSQTLIQYQTMTNIIARFFIYMNIQTFYFSFMTITCNKSKNNKLESKKEQALVENMQVQEGLFNNESLEDVISNAFVLKVTQLKEKKISSFKHNSDPLRREVNCKPCNQCLIQWELENFPSDEKKLEIRINE